MLRLAVATLLAASLVLAGCQSTPTAERDAATLRVGLAPNYPPIVFEQDGVLKGFEVDAAGELAAALGRRLRIERLEWEALIPSLEAGRIDIIMSGMSVTAERAERIAFTDAYLEIGQMALIRLTDAERLGTLDVLLNTDGRVGYVEATTGAAFVQSSMARATGVPFRDTDAGVAALKAGGIDVFVHDAPTVWRIGAAPEHQEVMGLFWPLTRESLAWAVNRSDGALLDEVNAQIARWRESGRLREILRDWVPVRVEVR